MGDLTYDRMIATLAEQLGTVNDPMAVANRLSRYASEVRRDLRDSPHDTPTRIEQLVTAIVLHEGPQNMGVERALYVGKDVLAIVEARAASPPPAS